MHRTCVSTHRPQEKNPTVGLLHSVCSREASSRLKPSDTTTTTPPPHTHILYSALGYAQSSHLHESNYSTLHLLKYLLVAANIYRMQLDFLVPGTETEPKPVPFPPAASFVLKLQNFLKIMRSDQFNVFEETSLCTWAALV